MGRHKTKALLIVAGVRKDEYRGILGLKLAENEREELKERGLRGVKLVISDGHKWIEEAAKKSFTGSSRQMCQVHLLQNV